MFWAGIFTSHFFWLFVALVGLMPLLAGWLCTRIALAPRVVGMFRPGELQTSYLGALTLPFALFLAFMVNDIWNRDTRYAQTLLQEVQRLDAMLDTTHACGTPCEPLQETLGDYARALSAYEWDEGWVNLRPEVSAAFATVAKTLAVAEADAAIAPHLRNGLLNGQIELRRLRNERYFILHSDLAPHRWLVVLLLGLLSQVGLAALHVGRPLPLRLAMVTFSIAFSVTLAYTVALAWPTVDESIVPSEELRRILQ